MTSDPLFSSTIPQFALYGETDFSHEPEFIHIEDIRERSARNGGVIKPHRHTHLFQILCIFSGETEVRLDDVNSTQTGSRVIIMPTGVVHGFKFDPDTRGVVLSIAVGMLGLDAENQVSPLLEGTLSQPRVIAFQENSELFLTLRRYLEQIRQELQRPREGQHVALFALLKLVLVTLKRKLQHNQFDMHIHENGVQLTGKFRNLLEKHYREHWKIGDYAKILHVSVSTLNRACQSILGSTAKKLIMERLHIEAKRRLIYTQETLDQISFHLGFKDTAYFSRVFKQIEGISPKYFRISTNAG